MVFVKRHVCVPSLPNKRSFKTPHKTPALIHGVVAGVGAWKDGVAARHFVDGELLLPDEGGGQAGPSPGKPEQRPSLLLGKVVKRLPEDNDGGVVDGVVVAVVGVGLEELNVHLIAAADHRLVDLGRREEVKVRQRHDRRQA